MQMLILTHEESDAERYNAALHTLEAWDIAQRMKAEQQAKEIARLREHGKQFAASFLERMNKYGQWEDGCFYYNRTCASELQEVIAMANQALKEEHP
jgi:hypothetical protein